MKSMLLVLLCLMSINVYAIEENIYNLSAKDTKAVINEKLKAANAKATVNEDLSVAFDTPQTFTPSSSDLFEKIESSGPRDVVNHRLILGDPKTGRIFHLNRELHVSQLDLVAPWTTKEKLKSLKAILNDMNITKIEKRK